MNILYITMGAFYRIFYDVHQRLRSRMKIGKTGFYVCAKDFFKTFMKSRSADGFRFLKEWEILETARGLELDGELVERYERRYFEDRSIWKAFNNDRRIFMGPYCKVTQDYRPSFSHDEIVRIFQATVAGAERLLDEIEPDVAVASNAPTTFGEYLLHEILKKRGVPRLILRPTKVRNNCAFTDDYLGNSFVEKDYKAFLESPGPGSNPYYDDARDYIGKFRSKGRMIYEGDVGFTLKTSGLNPVDFARAIAVDIRDFGRKRDLHRPKSSVVNLYYDRVLRLIRFKRQSRLFHDKYIQPGDLGKHDFVFYPLHAEPEIATTLFSEQTGNQIELARTIALQLPARYKLLVKEHPRCIGRRPTGYYRKLMAIPNVELAHPLIRPIRIMREAALMISIVGFAGLEAVFNRRPLITLGSISYNMLPGTMVNNVTDLKKLHRGIRWSLDNYRYDEEAVIAYISANLKNSVPIYLYSILLGKKRAMAVEWTEEKYEKDIRTLADFLEERVRSSLR